MTADVGKYLTNNAGLIQEVAAAQTSAANAIIAANGSGVLDTSFLPTGIGPETITATASASLTAGQLVNVYNNSGTANVRPADGSTTGKEANGFVLAAFSSSATATVYTMGVNNQVTGLTPGVQYLSDTTPGACTTTVPSGSGHIIQRVGFAATATAMIFQAQTPIALA